MKNFRTNFVFKVITVYLALNMVFPLAGIQTGMYQSFALTGGPSQPEFNSFTPIGTSDMVDLASGDFNYNIPIMDVGGYPLNLSYNSGITMDQEASWVGLGWNLNVGQINRNVRGLPDDFDGDEMIYENNMKKNITVGVGIDINPQVFGKEFKLGEKTKLNITVGMAVQYNNYEGISFIPSIGVSYSLHNNVSVGMNISSTSGEGTTITPTASIHTKSDETNKKALKLNASVGVSYNSRQGLSNINVGASMSTAFDNKWDKGDDKKYKFGLSGSGTVSYINNTVTPTKRFAVRNGNFNFNISSGFSFWGIEGEIGISAYGNYQTLDAKRTIERAYGYQNTEHATKYDILDFNRENDRIISKNTLVLPTTNYTFDLYSIQGQGIGGMFRPYRSQVQYVHDRYVEDKGNGASLGIELEGASGFHAGGNFTWSNTKSHSGVWDTPALSFFKEKKSNLNLNYERVYFKSIGEFTVDEEQFLLDERLGGKNPISIKITGEGKGKDAENTFRSKRFLSTGAYNYDNIAIGSKIARSKRELRNLAIQKITAKESSLDKTITQNIHAKPHHTAGYKILKNDGSRYVYGETAYNTRKEETTFAVGNQGDCQTGLVSYGGSDNTTSNGQGNDHYFNNIITPSYAHTYLLSSILSSDYEDVNDNGVDDSDLGSYTKFSYKKYPENTSDNYKWRVPYIENSASYNAGLYTLKYDQKGSYIYGEKELKYIHKIETKTHVAIFTLSDRKDALGTIGKNGGKSTAVKMQKIDVIKLYSKSDFNKNGESGATPIKTAHFEYSYALCKGVKNHTNVDLEGKLTLNKVYFTYANSKMGKYTPYEFHYDNINPNYSLKGNDVWGNYKPNIGGCGYDDNTTNSEFPYVKQNKIEQDDYVKAWTMSSVDLPSGGKIELEYESDDYQFVQNRKAMQMYKVVGVSPEEPNNLGDLRQTLYSPGLPLLNNLTEAKYIIVEIDNAINNAQEFKEKYIGNEDKSIFFRFLLNMTQEDYDYVEGYFWIDKEKSYKIFSDTNKSYAAIPMQHTDMEGGINGRSGVNIISKAGWYFGRQNMNRVVYGLNQDPHSENLTTIAKKMGETGIISQLQDIIHGPNELLRNRHMCARKFKPKKSWIRLLKPGNKLGGGSRIKKLKMHDNWDAMTVDTNGNRNSLNENNIYKQFYGQEYSYKLENGGSSGVATFEPNVSKENPFIEPFYDKGERLVAPGDFNYVEKPFGVSFFPSSKVTYSRVEVQNLKRINDTQIVKTNATGKVINTFYTTYDFPTKANFTDIDKPENWYSVPKLEDLFKNVLSGLIGSKVVVDTEMTYSQGFVVETNDMDGKTRKQEVFDENGSIISEVEYHYSKNTETNTLNNKLPVIDALGKISEKEIGTHYDVINDFRESYTNTRVTGLGANLAAFTIGPIPIIVPTGLPSRAEHTSTLHTVTTTKVIHSTGILKEKIATDLGAKVSTENIAWDAITGQVLVTKTKNEYDDAYYSINYPAHWKYKSMGLATTNIDFKGQLVRHGNKFVLEGFDNTVISSNNISDYFLEGDEIEATGEITTLEGTGDTQVEITRPVAAKLWVVAIDTAKRLTLMDAKGKIIGETGLQGSEIKFTDASKIDFKVVRSGYRNLQSASMASITTMTNPIDIEEDGNVDVGETIQKIYDTNIAAKIINASAIEYTDLWSPQCECLGIPSFAYEFADKDGNDVIDIDEVENDAPTDFASVGFNPYRYNVKGNYKAVKSYAYLTGRKADASPRNDGYFTSFNLFYTLNTDATEWQTDRDNWTFASQVSKYSPYGVELENKDALNRYSSAQYGFNYTLPTAVSSNSKYTEMGYDSFEDYQVNEDCTTTHFGFKEAIKKEQDNAHSTDKESHTGHKSIRVNSGTRATLEKRIGDCD